VTTASDHPPLRVWGYTAAILVILMALLAGEAHMPAFARPASGVSAETLNLGRLSEAAPHPLEIVALGSSKTLYAIDYDDRFTKRLAALPHPVAFHRVTFEGANFWDLEPALRALASHPPDMLLLESDLLLFDRGSRFPIRHDLLPLEKRLDAYLSGRKHSDDNYGQNRGAERFPSAQECAVRQSEPERLLYATRLSTARLSTPESRQKYLELLRALRSSGTQIVLLRLPRAAWAEALLPPWAAQSNAVTLPEFAARNGFDLWTADPLPAGAFCDEGHMTALGRDLYSRWLSTRLLAMRSARHG